MNYKRFSRFFCLAAACCVILAGAAAPLTAYAAEDDGSAELDVAQETRTLSGTWRWNDVLTVPEGFDSRYEIELDFLVSSDFVISDDNSSVELISDPYVGQFFVMALTDSGYFALVYSGSGIMFPYTADSGLYWDATYSVVSELIGSDVPELKDWGQTITFTRPQAVPAMFYDWFVANAVKQVSPMQTFLDNFTAPISGIWSVVTDVSNTIVSTPLLFLSFCFSFVGLCVYIFGRVLSRS